MSTQFPTFRNQPLPFPLLGPNDSSIHRGDRADTGDEQARPTEKGTGDAEATVDPTSIGGSSSISQGPAIGFDQDEELAELDGMEILPASDGRLGLTNTDNVPADDWAADTGPTRSSEEA